jgi:ankyrin repeat protein
MECCAQGNLKKVQRHFENGIDMQQSDYDDRTAMHVACAQGHLHVIRFLVDEIKVEVNSVDRFGRTPLFEATLCSNSHTVVDFLKKHGAKMPEKGGSGVHTLLDACADGDLAEVRKYVNVGGDLMAVDYDQRSALHIACSHGHLPVVLFLLENGVDANALDAFGRSPLDECKQRSFDEIESVLRDATAIVESVGEKKTLGFLMEAAAAGNVEGVQQYADVGGNLSRADYDDRTALHVACARGNLAVVEFLLEAEVDLSPVDRFGRTPYFEARQEGHEKIMHLLHDLGADDKTTRQVKEARSPRDTTKRWPDAAECGEQRPVRAHEDRLVALMERMEQRLQVLEGVPLRADDSRNHALIPMSPRISSPTRAGGGGLPTLQQVASRTCTHHMMTSGQLSMNRDAVELRRHKERQEQQMTSTAFQRALISNLSSTPRRPSHADS